ncbi:MAG: acyl-CoA thioesterase [Pirellulaceae bacterium]
MQQYTQAIRVRYDECDPMGFVHHSHYLKYFEIARTEMYRASGGNYRDFEASGLFVVVVRVECQYRLPARYDDMLSIHVSVEPHDRSEDCPFLLRRPRQAAARNRASYAGGHRS